MLPSLLTGTGWEAERSWGNPKDSAEGLWDLQKSFGRDGEIRLSILTFVVMRRHCLPNWAVIPACSTGGHPTAPPEQRGAGGVSLESEAGPIAGRAQRGMCSRSAENKSLRCYIIAPCVLFIASFSCVFLRWARKLQHWSKRLRG